MTKKKITLQSLRNQDREKVKIETKKVHKLSPTISTSNITELKELIYAGAKLVCDEIRNPK